MKHKALVLFAGCCAAGLLAGYAAKRLSLPRAVSVKASNGAAAKGAGNGRAGTAGVESGAAEATSSVIPSYGSTRSKETLESLKADSTNLYARLALWMVDASQEDVKAFWEYYRAQPNRSNDINDIIFINWARIDPLAATAAAKGTKDEHYAWWAWGCHDPEAALAAAIAGNPDRINNVTWAIGEFHSAWLLKHFDELPEDSRDNALEGLSKWDDHPDSEAILNFFKEKGYGYNEAIFKVLAVRDPWAAYDWIEENGSNARSRYGGTQDANGAFVELLAQYHPDVLQRIAEMTPSGTLRRQMEAQAFQTLVKSDLEEAIVQAKDTKAPVIAAERLATVGKLLVYEHPDRAFEVAQRLFEVSPDALESRITVDYPNGRSSSSTSGGSVAGFMDALVAADPRRAMKLVENEENEQGFSTTAAMWAARDLDGYADWVEEQESTPKRSQAAAVLISNLMERESYAEAAEWAQSISPPKDDPGQIYESQLTGVLSNWGSNNPEAARAWLNASNLSEGVRQQLNSLIPHAQ